MSIHNCCEIRSEGGIFQLIKDESENNEIAIIENAEIRTIDLSKFEKDELRMLLRYIHDQIQKLE